jgi:hypothetical protein
MQSPEGGYYLSITGREHVNKQRASVAERQSVLPPSQCFVSFIPWSVTDCAPLLPYLANDYDQLADRAEVRAARDVPVPSPRAKKGNGPPRC